MKQTESLKNVKRVGKNLAPKKMNSREAYSDEEESPVRGMITGLGLTQALGPFAPQVEDFLVQNVEAWTEKLGDFDEITSKVRRYAKQYPAVAIAGAAAIGLAAGFLLVNYSNSSGQNQRRS